MATGYIKLHRDIWEHKLWRSEPFTRAQAWVDMLLMANHKHSTIYIRGNKIELAPGQLAWSVRSLAERWRWSAGKVTRYIDMLEAERQVERQTLPATTVVTILMYQYYANGAEYHEPAMLAGKTARRRSTAVQQATPTPPAAQAETNDSDSNGQADAAYDATDSQKLGFEKFTEWIRKHAPNVARMKEPFTIEQYLKLSGHGSDEKGAPTRAYPPGAVREMLKRMHNHAGLCQKNVSAYYTLMNWFRLERERMGGG